MPMTITKMIITAITVKMICWVFILRDALVDLVFFFLAIFSPNLIPT